MSISSISHLSIATLRLRPEDTITIARDGDEVLICIQSPDRYISARTPCSAETIAGDGLIDAVAYVVDYMARDFYELTAN